LHDFFCNNIPNNKNYCNYCISDHDDAAAAAAAAANDNVGNVDDDNVQFQILSIKMLTMILMSKMITTPSHACLPSLSHACRCRDRRTPLHLSAFHGRTEVAKLLVLAKSDVAVRDRCGDCARRARVSCCALNLTRCAAVTATLPSNWPLTKTKPTWLPSCAAPARRNERFALFSRSHHAALRK
jgi:hypothetical protein